MRLGDHNNVYLYQQLRLDMILSSHVEGLYHQIWERALKQYTTPYLSVDLSRMAAAFDAPDVVTMEKIVAKLIVNGQISARIDSENKVLYARRGNTRQATFDKALATGRQVVLDSDDLLRRMSMIETGFEYRVCECCCLHVFRHYRTHTVPHTAPSRVEGTCGRRRPNDHVKTPIYY